MQGWKRVGGPSEEELQKKKKEEREVCALVFPWCPASSRMLPTLCSCSHRLSSAAAPCTGGVCGTSASCTYDLTFAPADCPPELAMEQPRARGRHTDWRRRRGQRILSGAAGTGSCCCARETFEGLL